MFNDDSDSDSPVVLQRKGEMKIEEKIEKEEEVINVVKDQ